LFAAPVGVFQDLLDGHKRKYYHRQKKNVNTCAQKYKMLCVCVCEYCNFICSEFLIRFPVVKLQVVVCYLQWVFWVGPFLGAALAAAYQMLVIRAMPFRAKQLAEET
jgi:hypothetical protein